MFLIIYVNNTGNIVSYGNNIKVSSWTVCETWATQWAVFMWNILMHTIIRRLCPLTFFFLGRFHHCFVSSYTSSPFFLPSPLKNCLRFSFFVLLLGVRADSRVLPKWEAGLCWEPEQRWRFYSRCGAQEDHGGSRWLWDYQEAQAVNASTVPQGVCLFFLFYFSVCIVFFFVNFRSTTANGQWNTHIQIHYFIWAFLDNHSVCNVFLNHKRLRKL